MCSVKRENNCVEISCNNIILDIEGTTTSITFVKDVLFPYVRKHLEAYVKENWDSEKFQTIVKSLRTQANEDKDKKLDGVVEIPEDGEKDAMAKAVTENVIWQMDLDSKAKSLKDLQGMIMESGYRKGEILGHIYDDVEPNLKSWTELGKSVYIYSSGSIHAQKLLYGHSEKGDLLPYIKGHFDTTVGKKGDKESYEKILEQISSSPSETVFFTDVPNEARAAKEAGLLAILLSREGNVPLMDEDKKEFQVITSFSEIQFENISKKRKVCVNNDEKSDNKSVESCEVSITPPKEPTNTNIQHHDDTMEVDEDSIKEKVSNVETSCVKLTNKNFEATVEQQNQDAENNDVEMKTTIDVVEGNKSKKDDGVVDSKTNDKLSNGNAVQTEIISNESKIESSDQDFESKKVKPEELSPSSDKLNPATKKIESENLGDVKVSPVSESKLCEEKVPLKVNKDTPKSHDKESEKNTQEQSNENSQVVQQNGDLAHNSCDVTESKCELANIVTQSKSDAEQAVEQSSGKLDNKETSNPDSVIEATSQSLQISSQSKPDPSNDLCSNSNENDLVGEKKISESSKLSSNVNDSVGNTVVNSSNNNMEVDEKTSVKASTNLDDGSPDNASPQKSNENDNVKSNEKATTAVEETESVKDSLAMDCNTDLKVNETILKGASEAQESENGISDDIKSDQNKLEELSSEPSKQPGTLGGNCISDNLQSNKNKSEELTSEPNKKCGTESHASEPDVIDTNLNPLDETTGKNTSLETVSEHQNVGECSPDQIQSDNIKLDDEGNATVTTVSAKTENKVDIIESSQQDSVEHCDDEKTETLGPSQNTDEKANESDSKLNTKEIVATDLNNGTNRDDLNHLGEKDKSEIPENGKVDENDAISNDFNEGKFLGKKINEPAGCEAKKCEVPENATIAAVVEA